MKEKKMLFPLMVEPFQEDFKGYLSWANMGNMTLRIASLHAEAHGFGVTYMKEHQRGWVLSRLAIEMEEMPASLQQFSISTWVSRIFRQFTDRNFEYRNASGEVVGRGMSTWALIDYQSRQPINLEHLPNGGFSAAVLDEVPAMAGYTRIRVTEPQQIASRQCVVSDLDINGHVNSIRFLDMAMDMLPFDWHCCHQLHRIEMSFGLEGRCGDSLEIAMQPLDEARFAFEIRRQADKAVLVKVLLAFKDVKLIDPA